MKIALAALLALAVSGPALAREEVVTTPTMATGEIRALGHSDKQAGYYDAASFSRTGDVVSIVALTAYAEGRLPDPGVHYVELTLSFDCPARTFKVTTYKAFDAEARLFSTAGAWPTWLAVAEGSPAAFLYPVVCGADGLRAGPLVVGDYKAHARALLAAPAVPVAPAVPAAAGG